MQRHMMQLLSQGSKCFGISAEGALALLQTNPRSECCSVQVAAKRREGQCPSVSSASKGQRDGDNLHILSKCPPVNEFSSLLAERRGSHSQASTAESISVKEPRVVLHEHPLLSQTKESDQHLNETAVQEAGSEGDQEYTGNPYPSSQVIENSLNLVLRQEVVEATKHLFQQPAPSQAGADMSVNLEALKSRSDWWQPSKMVMDEVVLPPGFWQRSQEYLTSLGVPGCSRQLIFATFVHESYYNFRWDSRRVLRGDFPNATTDYKNVRNKLEFLGDTIISSVLASYLVNCGTDEVLGDISKLVHVLRSNSLMSAVGWGPLKLAPMIQCSPDLVKDDETYSKPSWDAIGKANVVADTVEILVGSTFMEKGIGVASTMVLDNLLPSLLEVRNPDVPGDPISRLQERLMTGGEHVLPDYSIDPVSSYQKRGWVAKVYHKGQLLGSAWGAQKQKAKREAAYEALAKFTGGMGPVCKPSEQLSCNGAQALPRAP